MTGRVLIIAGSDPSGGAGIQADIKTVTALGGYAAAAITSLTVQNTTGVKSVNAVSVDLIRDQIEAVLDDIGADVVKIGMIGEPDTAAVIADTLEAFSKRKEGGLSVVLDPVLIATSGDALAANGVVDMLRERLIPLATVVTPNADEASALTGLAIQGPDDLEAAGQALCAMGAGAALVKGGHLAGPVVSDVLVAGNTVSPFSNERLGGPELHGTGCTLASAVATSVALGEPLAKAVEDGIAFVREAITAAPPIGRGAHPLNHSVHIQKQMKS
ncbi:MAG: bifunctional hydroxymethylpyrimidine kinase/phosphomethylpyrimidine kinase [Pseudomonadota bacterium]